MTRGQKLQELLIQILVVWFAFSNLVNVSYRPVLNRGLAAAALVIVLSSLVLHLLNLYKTDIFFKASKLGSSKKLWIFFAAGVAGILFCVLFGFMSLLYFSPLILLYPMYYFYQHQWFPRAILLFGLMTITYSQMRLTRNDRIHAVVMWMTVHPEKFSAKIIQAFDKKSLTARQAYDVANLLILHPDESMRDYKLGHEFAQLALKKKPNPQFSRKIAYTLACALIGEQKIENARKVASNYKIEDLQSTLESQALCEPLSSRQPASVVRRKKNKFYF